MKIKNFLERFRRQKVSERIFSQWQRITISTTFFQGYNKNNEKPKHALQFDWNYGPIDRWLCALLLSNVWLPTIRLNSWTMLWKNSLDDKHGTSSDPLFSTTNKLSLNRTGRWTLSQVFVGKVYFNVRLTKNKLKGWHAVQPVFYCQMSPLWVNGLPE